MSFYLNEDQVQKLLNIEDLTKSPTHAIALAKNKIIEALEAKFGLTANVINPSPIVSKENNFYKLGYSDKDETTKERYCKYTSEQNLFRTQMTSAVPETLETLAQDKTWSEKLYCFPGMVFRRDVVDRTHVGQPHQMDVWYLTNKRQMERRDLLELVQVVVDQVTEIFSKNEPEAFKKQGSKIEWRFNETEHNYTDHGIEVEIMYKGKWLEILECGLAGRKLLTQSGLGPEYSGLALGMGLDRFIMLTKNIEDIRILRDKNAKIQAQMSNLGKYKPVSNQPCIKRDMSIAVWKGSLLETLTEKALEVMGDREGWVEEITLVASTPYEDLPEMIRPRLGIKEGQDNWHLRIVFRDLTSSIPSEEANSLYTQLYSKLHEGEGGYALK